MSDGKRNIYSASSQQWRFIDPNRPSGMAPLVSASLVEKEKPEYNKNPDQRSGAYYYRSNSDQEADPNQGYCQGNSTYYADKDGKTSAQSRLSKYKK